MTAEEAGILTDDQIYQYISGDDYDLILELDEIIYVGIIPE